MIDILQQIAAIQREIGGKPGETVSAVTRRTYPADIADVWDAITDPERLKRWFLPVTGEFRVGGRFQVEGNADGQILACEEPSLLRVSYGHETSIVEIRLTAEEAGTVFELEHAVPVALAGSVAGALYVGPGWDGALLGLGLYLAGEESGDPVAAANSPETIEFSRHSISAWEQALRASGLATEEEIAAAVEAARAQFAP
ncbi:SRPBCC family protein [Acrocarpospora catenulata]|uniref:SRPBCC family protein n=1 Tax=Acrocarpospora catenulata TaxID=2836182 RepID=UPI001BDABC1F|nr:SRPBCC family protein [Acrocarpospora catenulata]